MTLFFNFNALPVELGLKIIGLAVSVGIGSQRSSRPLYEMALALASVSFNFRQATMPHLLHTVILSSSSQLKSFTRSIQLQKDFQCSSSRLFLNYSSMIRRLWSTECWDSVINEPFIHRTDYSAIYEILSGLDSLGISHNAFSLLYNTLECSNLPNAKPWTCQKVTFAGPFWRWKPLTSSVEGLRFLSRLTHLSLWIEDFSPPAMPTRSAFLHQGIANSTLLDNVPFGYMPHLTHLACLYHGDSNATTSDVSFQDQGLIAWTTAGVHPPSSFAQWPLSLDHLQYGQIIPFLQNRYHDASNTCAWWEDQFLQGVNDHTWQTIEQPQS